MAKTKKSYAVMVIKVPVDRVFMAKRFGDLRRPDSDWEGLDPEMHLFAQHTDPLETEFTSTSPIISGDYISVIYTESGVVTKDGPSNNDSGPD